MRALGGVPGRSGMRQAWIPTKEALSISQAYKNGPHTKMGMKFAGKKAAFGRKGKDGFHWEYSRKKLIQYLELRQQPNVYQISKQIGRSVYYVNALMKKLEIKKSRKMGLTYLEYENASQFINQYSELHHEQRQSY